MWYEILSNDSIVSFCSILKDDYSIAVGLALAVLLPVVTKYVKKTKTKADDALLARFKAVIGVPATEGGKDDG